MEPTDELRRELRRLVRQRDRTQARAAEIDAAIGATIVRMRELRIGWPEIGKTLGMTKQAAQQHYGSSKTDNSSRKY